MQVKIYSQLYQSLDCVCLEDVLKLSSCLEGIENQKLWA